MPEVEEEKRRRVVWAPYRLAGVAAAILAVAIPFGPEIFRGGISEATRSVTAPMAAVATDGAAAERTPASPVPTADVREASPIARHAILPGNHSSRRVSSPGTASDHDRSIAATFVDTENDDAVSAEQLPAEMATNHSGGASFAANNVSLPAELSASEGIFERSGLVNRGMHALVQPRDVNSTMSVAIRSASESIERRNDPMLAAIAQSDAMMAPPGSDDARLFTVGVTLGSGQVSNAKSATALLQNSYYFAVSVSPSDRLGIEMGASAFEQVKNVVSYTPPASASNGSGLWGKRAGVSNPTGRLEFGRMPNTPSGPRYGSSPTLDVMIPIGEFDPTLGNSSSLQDQQNARSEQVLTQATLVEQRLEQQLTYGAFFYDHRLQIAQDWDLCGRLAVGGANDAIVGGARAYAAYNPTKTLTFTLGVGGSTLYNLTMQKVGASSNYGIYYGIETGF